MLPGALSFILLSKMIEFSPKNFTFLQIELDIVVPDTWYLWQIDPWGGADAPEVAKSKFLDVTISNFHRPLPHCALGNALLQAIILVKK